MQTRPTGTTGVRHPRLSHLAAALGRAHAQAESARENEQQGAQAPAVPAASAA